VALAAIAVPVAAKALRRLSQSIQSRNQGSSPVSNVMHKAASGLDSMGGRARQRGF
jgi:hypothetical protein